MTGLREKAMVVINEQHSLLDEQLSLLDTNFHYHNGSKGWELLKVPAEGWTLTEQLKRVVELEGREVVFLSPIPAMIKWLSKRDAEKVFLFINDTREKKELPGGKIIFVVPKTGWKLI